MTTTEKNIYYKYAVPVNCGFLGALYGVLKHVKNRRPWYTSSHKTALYTISGIAIGFYFDGLMEKYYSERDAQIKHYMETFPDDFVENKRKYKEVFSDWYPAR